MKVIKDRFDNEWTFEITLGRLCDELNAKLGVNLLAPAESSSSIDVMLRNVGQAMDALWILNRKQAEGKKVKIIDNDEPKEIVINDAMDWFDLFDAVTMKDAMQALADEVFFSIRTLAPQEAPAVQKTLKRAEVIRQMELEKIVEVMESEEVEKFAKEEIDKLMVAGLESLRENMKKLREKNMSTLSSDDSE